MRLVSTGARCVAAPNSEFMVGDTGIEPVTPSMSTKCSTAELIAHEYLRQGLAPYEMGRGCLRAGSGVYKRSRLGDQGLLMRYVSAL